MFVFINGGFILENKFKLCEVNKMRRIKQKYHYYMAHIFAELHHVLCKAVAKCSDKFHYHVDAYNQWGDEQ